MKAPDRSDAFIREVRLDRAQVKDWGKYPYSLPMVSSLKTLKLHRGVTFLVGENGCGKSTLLEAIATAWGFNPEGGSRHFSFKTRNSHSKLHRDLRLVKTGAMPTDGYFLRAESFYNVATEIERLDEGWGGPKIGKAYGSKSLHEQSHGESFLALMQNRLRPGGLFLLDEPEAALSPTGLFKMLSILDQLESQGSQFIIATHSPILMAFPRSLLYEVRDGALRRTDFQDTAHFALTRRFMDQPNRFLEDLLRS
ncbi:AAA family ATPase [bacterium]|nr:AAA family ATPase [bacterium]